MTVLRALLITTVLLLIAGCGANSALTRHGEGVSCSERLQYALRPGETIDLRLTDDARVRGSFRAATADSLILERDEDPTQRRSFSMEEVAAVSYARDGFQPGWIVAGLFGGIMMGAVVNDLFGDSEPCSELGCAFDGLNAAGLGGLIGLGIGTVLAGALPEGHEIVCQAPKRSGRGVTR
jgi:hypothetical protein